MPKYKQIWYNGGYYGGKPIAPGRPRQSIGRIPLGLIVRKQLGKHVIFRYRKGNDVAGSLSTKHYQDKYKYFVPPSINNLQGLAARVACKEAVNNWKTVLTDEEKADWKKKAFAYYPMSGWNLYFREYVKDRVKDFARYGLAKYGQNVKYGPLAL